MARTTTTMRPVRRVVLQRRADGWYWKAQAANWRTVDVARRPVAREDTARRHVQARFPDAEIVVG